MFGSCRYFFLCLIAAGAGFTDLRDGKVYNWWLFLGAVAGILLRGVGFFQGAMVFLAPALFLFRFRMMGAGDGKLMAVIGGYLGVEAGFCAICAGLAVGAVYSLCRLWCGKSFRARLTYFFAYVTRTFHTKEIKAYVDLSMNGQRHKIPLAACLAAGVWIYALVLRT